jgi:hypothetical protein
VDYPAHGKESFDGVSQIMISGVAGSVARKIPAVKALHYIENTKDRLGVEMFLIGSINSTFVSAKRLIATFKLNKIYFPDIQVYFE